MSKRRSKKQLASATPRQPPDFLPKRGTAAVQVAIVDEPDIEAGAIRRGVNIRRGRVVCSYDRMHSRGAISHEQREAADKYAILREREMGARSGGMGEKVSGSLIVEPTQAMVIAAASMRAANEALGRHGSRVVSLLVIEGLTATEIGSRIGGCSNEKAMGWIDMALTRLAEHWGMIAR